MLRGGAVLPHPAADVRRGLLCERRVLLHAERRSVPLHPGEQLLYRRRLHRGALHRWDLGAIHADKYPNEYTNGNANQHPNEYAD